MGKKAISRITYQYKPKIQLSEEQLKAKELINNKDITIITGSAGSGKSLVACEAALDLIRNKDRGYNFIMLTRPYVTIEDYGFLPGDLEEKLDPNYEVLRYIFAELIDKVTVESMFADGSIKILPTGFSRGITIQNAVIILDESQNFTIDQFIMLLTRMGKYSKMIITFDVNQVDISKTKSAISIIERLQAIEDIGFINLKANHRHPLISKIIDVLPENKKK